MRIPLASKSDPAIREIVSSERLVNWYAARSPAGGKSDFALYPTPGQSVFSMLSSDLCRGLHTTAEGLIALMGTQLMRVNANGTAAALGEIPGTLDTILSQNADFVVIVSDSEVYTLEISTGTVAAVIDSDLPDNVLDSDNCDGFQLYGIADRRVFFSTVADPSEISALDYFTVEGSDRPLVALKVFRRETFLFQEDVTSVYRRDPDNADNPFTPLQGAVIPVGILNKHCKRVLGGGLYWIDNECVVRTLNSYSPVAIGNEGVQSDLRALNDKSVVRLWGYIDGDRGFLNIYSPSFFWSYDLKEQRWHNRQSYGRATWRCKHYARFGTKDIVSADQSGDLFSLDRNAGDDDGQPIVRSATLPPISNFPKGFSINALDADIEVGTGLGGSAASDDAEPHVTLFASYDGGKTESSLGDRSLGRRGQGRKQVRWTRLGRFGREGGVLRFQSSSKAPFAFMSVDGAALPRLS